MEDLRARILLVDDEPLVLDALRRQHGRRFAISSALGAPAALALVRSEAPFAVVVSDHNMPDMDGVSFLEQMRELAPSTVRILLTGQAASGLAAMAASRGAVFRFIAKPCPAEELSVILQAAVNEHRSLVAVHSHLEPTSDDQGGMR